ncbi:hypothetical protein A3J90_06410 [candidate division WOR-1 bacterium RIFOXYC2_FULL_37_10]|nr:MAG: hypothetical protein A2246_04480 [candidate division WOR-1 bacterium RIFOXYA2_FULL_37_7]OGC35425.1 MAG: hypothetical protein A3J90_06410 [candidate division WOR-1 bacterium RIFOXYC2_FULL_37_10]
MKKIILLLVMLGLLASSSLAMGISGVGVSPITNTLAVPFLRLAIDSDRVLDLGVSYGVSTANVNTTTALARFNTNFMSLGTTDIHWGLALAYSTTSANTSSMTLDLNVGAETKLNSNVALFGDIHLVDYTTTTPAGTTNAYNLLTGPGVANLGIMLYL